MNQSSFAAFHFTVTSATLYLISRPDIGMFTPQRARFLDMMPLGLAMCLNVILPNLSLAFFYGTKIPRAAVYTLLPICVGVGIVSYYDQQAVVGARVKTTTPRGIIFAFSGVLASSLYTVWIGTYHKKFGMSSMQLLFNQAPISVFLLLYVIPFTDQVPDWSKVSMYKWKLIALVRLQGALEY
jgi:solute carrier family 35, member E3